MSVLTWLGAIGAALTAVGMIYVHVRRFVRFLAKVGRGIVVLATLPAAVQELSAAMRELADQTRIRLDSHDAELTRLALFHPKEITP